MCCCTPPSWSEQCLCSLDEPTEPHMLRDPWRDAAYQAPALLLLPPSLPLSSSLLPPSSQKLRGSTERLSSATKAAVVGRPPFEVSFSKLESVQRRTAAQRSDSKLTLHREELSERHHIETLSSTRVYKLPRPARVLTVCVLCYSD